MSDVDGADGQDGKAISARTGQPTGWRRKWRRAPAERRRQAAGTLADLFVARRPVGALTMLVVLAAAAVLHGALLPLVRVGRGQDRLAVAARDSYLRKVVQTERAKRISRDLSGRATMPLPPEDPESFVSRTMSDALTSDIQNVIGNLLDVDVTRKISGKVTASLAEELKAAARKIAEKKLSEEEIKDIQEGFRRKAHEAAKAALHEHRVQTQVKRAALSTTQWYEEKVSAVLFRNLHYEMYRRPGWAAGPRLWYTTWAGGNRTPRWHELESLGHLNDKLEALHRVLNGHRRVEREDRYKTKAKVDDQGRRFVKDGRGRNIAVVHAAWPGPNLEQARELKKGFHYYYNRSPGGYKNQSIIPSWNDYLYSGPQCYGLIEEFYPHRREKIKKLTDRVDALWRKTFDLLGEYVMLAEQGADEAGLKDVHGRFFKTARELLAECRKLTPEHHLMRGCQAINRAVLLERLRDTELRKRNYARFVDKMVETLWPLIRTYAEGQFEEGLIERTGSAEEALKQFPARMLPLVRRDVKKLLPKEKFDRIVFYPYRYRSKITAQRCPPSDEDYQEERKRMAEALKQHPELAAYAEQRRALLKDHFRDAVDNTVQVIRKHVFARGLLTRNISDLAEGVDYADKVQERLDAREAAKRGRGQDLARIAKDGLPDTSARLVALQYGLARGGLVEPVTCPTSPAFLTEGRPGGAVRSAPPRLPPMPAKWGFVTQAELSCPFENSPAYETIPFLSRFPRLDGDLTDWGKIRPLILRPYGDLSKDRYRGRPIVLYAAWNYQGFFFGYRVHQPAAEFFYPEQYRTKARKRASWAGGGFTGQVRTIREQGVRWLCKGDHLRLMFDTLDARSDTRGDPHTQEFVVVPMGSDTDPTIPGFERIIKSRRDAEATEWRRIIASGKIFLPQPPAEHGPDGTGVYRVTRMQAQGPLESQHYTVEVFVPRSLFNTPVFAPGWHVGFDAAVAMGAQGQFRGQIWSPLADAVPDDDGAAACPRQWGDLLLLGTDPFLAVQNADREGSVARAIVPGHSYLLTVVDPDRNIYASRKDTILLSAEVVGREQDMEVFLLTETSANSGMFRGYVNTQPGRGRQVQGVVEAMPGQEVRLGYVDLGNAKGKRNVIFELRLPVVAPLLSVASSAGGSGGPP